MIMLSYLLPVLALAMLCAAWVGVQLLARKLGTKNHIEHKGSCCGSCTNRQCSIKKEEELV